MILALVQKYSLWARQLVAELGKQIRLVEETSSHINTGVYSLFVVEKTHTTHIPGRATLKHLCAKFS